MTIHPAILAFIALIPGFAGLYTIAGFWPAAGILVSIFTLFILQNMQVYAVYQGLKKKEDQ
tara:strand:+ start:203 stop:385 length:183 start_codon:yes stop_codon:yes gene_type:complete